jgi:hypothetical protein
MYCPECDTEVVPYDGGEFYGCALMVCPDCGHDFYYDDGHEPDYICSIDGHEWEGREYRDGGSYSICIRCGLIDA